MLSVATPTEVSAAVPEHPEGNASWLFGDAPPSLGVFAVRN